MPYFIGIGGPSGSGKSVLASTIKNHHAGNCEIIHIDSYYDSSQWDHKTPEEKSKNNYDHPSTIEIKRLANDLLNLKKGNNIHRPNYDFVTHSRTDETTEVSGKTPIIIVEGIMALHFPEVRQLLDLSIAVTTDTHECFVRRKSRDIAERGRTPEQVEAQYRNTVHPMCKQFILPSLKHATTSIACYERQSDELDQLLATIQSNVTMRQQRDNPKRIARLGKTLFGNAMKNSQDKLIRLGVTTLPRI